MVFHSTIVMLCYDVYVMIGTKIILNAENNIATQTVIQNHVVNKPYIVNKKNISFLISRFIFEFSLLRRCSSRSSLKREKSIENFSKCHAVDFLCVNVTCDIQYSAALGIKGTPVIKRFPPTQVSSSKHSSSSLSETPFSVLSIKYW